MHCWNLKPFLRVAFLSIAFVSPFFSFHSSKALNTLHHQSKAKQQLMVHACTTAEEFSFQTLSQTSSKQIAVNKSYEHTHICNLPTTLTHYASGLLCCNNGERQTLTKCWKMDFRFLPCSIATRKYKSFKVNGNAQDFSCFAIVLLLFRRAVAFLV